MRTNIAYLAECKYSENGKCIKSSCFGYTCGKRLWVNVDNENNSICDLAGYEPKNNKTMNWR